MVNIMTHGNRFDVGMRVREESCLIFSSGDGWLGHFLRGEVIQVKK